METLRSTTLNVLLTTIGTHSMNAENISPLLDGKSTPVISWPMIEGTSSSPITSFPGCTIHLDSIDSTKVNSLVESFKNLNKSEMILFLTKIGGGAPSRIDLEETRNWLKSNFVEDEMVALPKEEVYTMYRDHSQERGLKPVSSADFGKVIKQVFPKVKARRLGQRGQSKYCYANIKVRVKPEEPFLPRICPMPIQEQESTESFLQNCGKIFGTEFSSLQEVAQVLSQQGSCTRLHERGGSSSSSTSGGSKCGRSLTRRLESPSGGIIMKREDSCDEMSMYFKSEESPSASITTTGASPPPQWPHLRSLLTSSTKFQPLKRSRHYSSITSDHHSSIFDSTIGSFTNGNLRSQSVPLCFIQDEGEGCDNEDLDSGLSSLTNTPSSSSGRNPMLSSVSDDVIRVGDLGVDGMDDAISIATGSGPGPSLNEIEFLYPVSTFDGAFDEGL